MTTIISADNGTVSGTAGLKSTADSSGILQFQSGANTAAVTIDASQNVGVGKTSPQAVLDYRRTVSVISTNTAAVASRTYVFTATLTLTLPASPTAGDWVEINNSSATTTPVVARNGSNIQSSATDLTIDNATASFTLTYADATRGWVLTL
jgi:hypothetical protein